MLLPDGCRLEAQGKVRPPTEPDDRLAHAAPMIGPTLTGDSIPVPGDGAA